VSRASQALWEILSLRNSQGALGPWARTLSQTLVREDTEGAWAGPGSLTRRWVTARPRRFGEADLAHQWKMEKSEMIISLCGALSRYSIKIP
jgi:hypothetical protein